MTLALMGIGVALLAAVTGWLVWKAINPLRALSTWHRFAGEQGMQYHPPPVPTAMQPGTIEGRYRGREVRVEARSRIGVQNAMVVTVRFDKPLDAGLLVHHGNTMADEPEPVGEPFSTGNPVFDKQFTLRARDTRRARELLAAEAVDLIEDVVARGMGIRISDERLVFYEERTEPDTGALGRLLDAVVALADHLAPSKKVKP